jgi:hypothetical protein
MDTRDPEAATPLEQAREAFELATVARARAYASPGTPTEVGSRSARAATAAGDARRAYEKAILEEAGVLDPGLSHLP